ncbi:MAG: hypothetical protein KBD01_17330 [Acidobacteria bacterium]|nr:hypothetical protein [Acidobacteriota bacterium]
MAVYERRYRGYAGAFTPAWSRFLVLTRYGFEGLFGSRLFVVFLVLAALAPLGGAVYLYLRQNVDLVQRLGGEDLRPILPAGPEYFFYFLRIQGSVLCFIAAIFIGPGLIARDLRNGALPLYLARPLGRWEYVCGKAAVLALLMSAITWVPGLLLFALQAALERGSWLAQNWRIAPAVVAASAALIVTLTLVSLAVSSLVKWRPLAGLMVWGIVSIGTPFALALNGTLDTRLGGLFAIGMAVPSVWSQLLGLPPDQSFAGVPPVLGWLTLGLACALSLLVLSHRIRAQEVVR